MNAKLTVIFNTGHVEQAMQLQLALMAFVKRANVSKFEAGDKLDMQATEELFRAVSNAQAHITDTNIKREGK